MRNAAVITMLTLITFIAGCHSEDAQIAENSLPEVNDHNCHRDNLAKIHPEEKRQKLAGLCLRSTKSNPGELKVW